MSKNIFVNSLKNIKNFSYIYEVAIDIYLLTIFLSQIRTLKLLALFLNHSKCNNSINKKLVI